MSEGPADAHGAVFSTDAVAEAENPPTPFTPLVPLEPGMRADDALRAIHRALLDVIVANQDGVRDVLEGDHLHDFRVAVRRTRTGLRQVKRVYPAADARRFAAGFRELAAGTGAARDLEVFLGGTEELEVRLGASTVGELAPLWDALRAHEAEERRRCSDLLAAPAYGELIAEWREFLEQPTTTAAAAPPADAARPVRGVAADRIARAYARVAAPEHAVDQASAADAFHRLRLECKKLRYLLEFFGGLFDREGTERFVASLRAAQDALGLINDLRVQGDWIDRVGQGPRGAIARLAAHLDATQQEERRRFVEGFAGFVAPATGASLEHLLNAGTTG